MTMTLAYLLDTSIYSQPLKPTPNANVVARWKTLGDGPLAISVITEAELRYGLALKGSAKLDAAYAALLKGRFPVLPVDQVVGDVFAEMKATQQRAGKPVADLDLLIAATARTHGLIVATLNIRHFTLIADLVVEDWSLSELPPDDQPRPSP